MDEFNASEKRMERSGYYLLTNPFLDNFHRQSMNMNMYVSVYSASTAESSVLGLTPVIQ